MELMQEILLRSRCKNIIESQDCITLKGLDFLDPEEDTTAALPLMDDSQVEVFSVVSCGHRQREITQWDHGTPPCLFWPYPIASVSQRVLPLLKILKWVPSMVMFVEMPEDS